MTLCHTLVGYLIRFVYICSNCVFFREEAKSPSRPLPPHSTPTTRRTRRRKFEIKTLKYHIIFFSLNLILVIIFKCHFDTFQNQPPGEPRKHHLGEVLQGRSKSKFNITLSYSIVFWGVQGSIIQTI